MTLPTRPRLGACLLACLTAGPLASSPAQAQHATAPLSVHVAQRDTITDTRRGAGRCFGTYVDRGCALMLQYEVGYRVPMAGRSPRLDAARPRDRSDRSQLFIAGGLMIPVSSRDALGAVYDAGAGDEKGTRAIGVRWARGFAHETRIDLTIGATWLPLLGDTVLARRRATANGAFMELALHGSNALTLVARDEAYRGSGGVKDGTLLFAGARAEAVPAAVLTMIGVVLTGIAVAATGPNW